MISMLSSYAARSAIGMGSKVIMMLGLAAFLSVNLTYCKYQDQQLGAYKAGSKIQSQVIKDNKRTNRIEVAAARREGRLAGVLDGREAEIRARIKTPAAGLEQCPEDCSRD